MHWTTSLHHDGSPRYVTARAYTLGERVSIRLRTGLNAPVERVFLRISPDGNQSLLEMRLTQTDATCRWWEVEFPLTMPRNNYRFWLLTPEGEWWLTALGAMRHTPTDAHDFVLLADYQAPSWVQDAVFYQIFPDRFADGDPTNNVRSGEYLYHGKPVIARRWEEAPASHDRTGAREFFGGDLQGILQKLDYLEELGISALYLTPIFTSPSNHKYDVEDYLHVDPHFGGEAALIALRQALQARGIRLVLDMIPNHCGATHPWFLKAQANPTAPEAEFFTFDRGRNEYTTWLGIHSLPKLNYRSQRLREIMYANKDAITRYWLRPPFSIDGWRIDVANMLARQGESQLGHKIGRGMRRASKEETPHAYLLGELFFDGTSHLQGDELDAGMNYQGFMLPLQQWLAPSGLYQHWRAPWARRHPLPTEALVDQWRAFLAAIPWQIAMQQLNLLDSHDTPRISGILGGEEDRVRLAATLLFTYPGVPCVYYGDEIGLDGGGDPDNRRCMPWQPQKWNHELRALYQTLIRLRRTSPALRWGGIQFVYAANETLAYLREAPEERLLVVARRSSDGVRALPVSHVGLEEGTRLRNVLTGTEARIVGGMLPLDSLPSLGAQVWQVLRDG
jgi:alpha-glucosidase